jgi:hypothetical protein
MPILITKYPHMNYVNPMILYTVSLLQVGWWIELDHCWRNTEARRFCNDL